MMLSFITLWLLFLLFSGGWYPDELNHELSSTITGIDKEIQSISIIDDEILMSLNVMKFNH